MNPVWLPWIGFASASLVAGGIFVLAQRWLQSGRVAEADDRLPRVSLRLPEENDAATAPFDRAFGRFVSEGGLPLDPTLAMLLLLGVGLLAGAALFVVFENALISFAGVVATAVVLMLAAAALRARRQQQILENLPSVVEMLARTVRAGESMEQALHIVAKKARGPLAADLRRCVRQIDMGLSVTAALRLLEERHRLLDVRMLVGALAVHRQAGGNLPATLERLSLVTRERLAYRRQLQSMTASARLAAMIISLAAPILFVYFLYTQQYIENMLNDPTGRFFLLLAAGLEIVGILWMLALSRSEI
jgi:tight adherence protein B